ncbi:MAG: molybdopterin-dependent oxidoreductase [Arcobacteraceae bacterium]|nr:molybdopterin-dependent oxidoreductase [Arcobacteraceae bacterium]
MINRRNFIKQTLFFSTLPTTYLFATNLPTKEQSTSKDEKKDLKKITYFSNKSICPLCSIGCHLIVNKQDDNGLISINTIEGDKKSLVNQGELCQKISQLHFKYDSYIPRIETPLLKMTNEKYDKNGILTPISWEKAFDIMEQKSKQSLKKNGIDGVGTIVSESLSIYESYALAKLFKGGFRSNNIGNINYEVERNAFGLIQTFGIDGSNGTFDDISQCDVFLSFNINFTEDFQILYSKVLREKYKKNEQFSFINIITNENQKIDNADINFQIKPDSEIFLLNYLINQTLQNIQDEDLYFLQNRVVFATFDNEILINDDKLLQWEISFNTYKKYFQKFTLDFVIDKIKITEEDISQFKFKLALIKNAYTKNNTKVLCYLDSKKDSISLKVNILLHSLHLLSNNFGKIGCGILYLHSQKLSATTSLNSANSSQRLPCGMFTKYKQHREKTESIWNLPENTLNSIATENIFATLKKFNDKTTNFLWILGCNSGELTTYSDYLNDVKDSFIVYSNPYFDDFSLEVDLVLPTANHFEKHIGYENSQREITLGKQHIEPYGESMSELWQIVEFSKRFKLKEVWGNSKIDNTFGLKNVLENLSSFKYTKETTLFEVLFANLKSKRYPLSSEEFYDSNILNSEVKSDKRSLFGENGKLFHGYKFFIQKYLFEELRLFGAGNGYDLATFSQYSSDFYEKWPIISTSETKYRFNTSDDFYTKRLSTPKDQFIFYGKLGGKQLPFGDEYHITSEALKELKYRAKIFIAKEV